MQRFLSLLRFPKRLLSKSIYNLVRSYKRPRMCWGYKDSDGTWRLRTRVSDTAFIYHPENIRMADNVFVWHYTILDGTGGLDIGEGAQIGAWVGIFTHSSHIAIRLLGDHYQEVPEYEKPAFSIVGTKIGRYVFIGAGAKILPGVNIGDGALVSAGAIVSKDVPPFAVVAGNPGKVIGDVRKFDQSHLTDPRLKEWYNAWQDDSRDKRGS